MPPRVGEELGCEGEPIREEECGTGTCPAWGPWTDWTPCTEECGGGSRSKVRLCLEEEGEEAEGRCVGEDASREECNTQVSIV